METYPDPSLIGKAFVRQYYTQMHKDPNVMHRFYLDKSSFVYGGSEIGSEEPVLGQKAIHDKIISLELQQVHAKIKQVDSYSTLGNGIVVQVTGELSVRRHPMRAFVQTFVLGQDTPKKYYVHNDIFRYQDDDLVSEGENNENQEEGGEATPQPLMNVGEYVTIEPEVIPEPYEAPQVEPHPQETSELPPNNWDYTEVTENGLDTPTVGEFPTATDPIESEPHEEPFSPAEQSSESESKGPSTWASRLTKQSGSRPLNSTAIPTSQALPQRDVPRPPKRQPDANRPPQNAPPPNPSALKDNKKTTPIATQDSSQIFVGGLPAGVKEFQLREVFEKLGKVRDVRLHPKNFAFVEFEDPACVKDIITSKAPFVINGKTLNIEPKRSQKAGGGPRGDRERPPRERGVGGGKPRGGKPPKR